MKTPLVDVEILSIYKKLGQRVLLPSQMRKCTPDTHKALVAINSELETMGGNLYLSDLFRSYDMQLQSHLDWKTRKKEAFSPQPGGSLHESGRAFDLDLDSLKITLSQFWKIAAKYGVSPIITKPDTKLSESWHFDCRGSHNIVYGYYGSGNGTNMKPYAAMAASAILTIGVQVDMFKDKLKEASIQSGLIRLGFIIGNIDGEIGFKTCSALEQAGVDISNIDTMLLGVENLLQQKFPEEYQIGILAQDEDDKPNHIIT